MVLALIATLIVTFVMGLLGTTVAAWLQQRGWSVALTTAIVNVLTTMVILPLSPPYRDSSTRGSSTPHGGRLAVGVVVVSVVAFGATILGVTFYEAARDRALFSDQRGTLTYGGVPPLTPVVEGVDGVVDDNDNDDDQRVEVPSVSGQKLEDALDKLNHEDYDFQVTVEERSHGLGTGFVIGTDPQAGERVEKGSPITVWVSTGPPTTIPPTTGPPTTSPPNGGDGGNGGVEESNGSEGSGEGEGNGGGEDGGNGSASDGDGGDGVNSADEEGEFFRDQ